MILIKDSSLGKIICILLSVIVALLILFQINSTNTFKDLTNLSNNKEEVSKDEFKFHLSIPKIGISIPIIENVDGNDKSVYNQALQNGIAHFSGSGLPNENKNIFIFGHSSSTDDNSRYGSVFSKIHKLEPEDSIQITHNKNEYVFYVQEKRIIEKDDLSVLDAGSEKKN